MEDVWRKASRLYRYRHEVRLTQATREQCLFVHGLYLWEVFLQQSQDVAAQARPRATPQRVHQEEALHIHVGTKMKSDASGGEQIRLDASLNKEMVQM